jgi:hypothetical protein
MFASGVGIFSCWVFGEFCGDVLYRGVRSNTILCQDPVTCDSSCRLSVWIDGRFCILESARILMPVAM